MKRVLKWTAIGLAAAAGVALLAAVGMVLATDMRLARTYTVEVVQPAIRSDPATSEVGRHLAEVYCARCHGDELEGGPFFAAEGLGYVDAPNLTGGSGGCHGEDLGGATDDPSAPPAPNLTPGGELRGWQEADFLKLMREGTTPTGREISHYMPWKAYSRLRDEELRALWLYLQGVPAATG